MQILEYCSTRKTKRKCNPGPRRSEARIEAHEESKETNFSEYGDSLSWDSPCGSSSDFETHSDYWEYQRPPPTDAAVERSGGHDDCTSWGEC